MNLEERIALHRRMAEGYRDAYLGHDVHEGGSYDGWEFADDAVYASPYFTGDEVIPLDENLAVGAAACATMEAKAYAATFADWGPAEFTRWETFPNDEEYGPFLELAIGVRGPFQGATEYVDALVRTLEKHGLS